MSLTPAFLDALRDRLTLSDIVGAKVTWDRRKSQPAKGDYWAPCPFHNEKTPSFHVDDTKGFYYCFGCQAKGDAISFVKETERLSFPEAVERLAASVGMALPDRDPAEAARSDRRGRLTEVMEAAVQMFGLALRSAGGQGARDYVAGRGLAAAAARFELGYAPASRTHLAEQFRARGQTGEAVAAGLLITPDDGGAPYDRFRDRLMFPIRDPRGRCIAFGARALRADQQPKYLNSPETEVFSKGRTLYHHGPARTAAAKAGTVIVAEGYVDVIALAMAGFEHAVAPLGTAITEEQLALIWRMADEPVIALDGDAAGLRAAYRLIDLALPLLGPGKSLRFCLLPQGRDPDELIRAEGPGAMARLVADARPLAQMLWTRETTLEPLDTPERRAALDARLRAALAKIADPSVRAHYGADMRERRRALFAPAPRVWVPNAPRAGRGSGARGFGPAQPQGPMEVTRASALAQPDSTAQGRVREACILLIACLNPDALGPVESALDQMTIESADLAPIRDALLAALAEGAEPIAAITARIGADPLARLAAVPQARAYPLARPGQDPARVAQGLRVAIARHEAELAYAAERREASRDVGTATGEDWTCRLRDAGQALARIDRAALEAESAEALPAVSELQQMLDARLSPKKNR